MREGQGKGKEREWEDKMRLKRDRARKNERKPASDYKKHFKEGRGEREEEEEVKR